MKQCDVILVASNAEDRRARVGGSCFAKNLHECRTSHFVKTSLSVSWELGMFIHGQFGSDS